MIAVRQTARFTAWLDDLRDLQAKARINIRIRRLTLGNFGDAKFFDGIGELRVDYGPGYRVYFVRRGTEVVILLAGRHQEDTAERHCDRHDHGEGDVMMTLATIPWDAAEHLDSEEAIAAYLNAAFEDGDLELIKAAIADDVQPSR